MTTDTTYKTMTTDTLESIRAFALTHGESAFADLATAALNDEEWARKRIAHVIAIADRPQRGLVLDAITLDSIRSTDTTRAGRR